MLKPPRSVVVEDARSDFAVAASAAFGKSRAAGLHAATAEQRPHSKRTEGPPLRLWHAVSSQNGKQVSSSFTEITVHAMIAAIIRRDNHEQSSHASKAPTNTEYTMTCINEVQGEV